MNSISRIADEILKESRKPFKFTEEDIVVRDPEEVRKSMEKDYIRNDIKTMNSFLRQQPETDKVKKLKKKLEGLIRQRKVQGYDEILKFLNKEAK